MTHPFRTRPEAQRRVAEAMARFVRAVEAVEAALVAAPELEIPRFVFALDLLDDVGPAGLPAPLARAERDRRQARAALHAVTEHVALELVPGPSRWQSPAMPHAPGEATSALSAQREADLTTDDALHLDRFITVLERARRQGASFQNGTFIAVGGNPGKGAKGEADD